MRYVFDHVHILCTELEPMLTFLTEAFGAQIVRRRMAGAAGTIPKPGADVLVGDCMLYVISRDKNWQAPDPTASVCGYNHIGFIVDDLDSALRDLAARADTRLVREPFMSGKRLCAFVAGPDNLYVEIMQEIG